MTSPHDDLDDDALVALALAGNARAFETLVRRHEGRVLRVLRLLGVRVADREDVAQDVFLRVFRHLRGYKPGRSFEAWVYRVAVNATHDWRDRARRVAGDEVPWPDRLGEVRPDPSSGREADRLDLARRLEAALGTLTDREREAFVLVEVEGLDSREAARALGIAAITVRRHLSLARSRLRHSLDEWRQEP